LFIKKTVASIYSHKSIRNIDYEQPNNLILQADKKLEIKLQNTTARYNAITNKNSQSFNNDEIQVQSNLWKNHNKSDMPSHQCHMNNNENSSYVFMLRSPTTY